MNATAGDTLHTRIGLIWQHRDFGPFFAKYAKRPPYPIKKGCVIFNADDTLDRLYYFASGYAKTFRLSAEGRETITYLYGPGSVLGFRSFASREKVSKQNGEALTDCMVQTISHGEYAAIAAQEPSYLIDLIHVFIDRLESTERQVEMFITTDTTARVANFLLDCAVRFCPPGRQITNTPLPNTVTLPFELTHQRIADFVGSFRETVTVALHRLEKDHVLRIQRCMVTILDMKKLRTHATHER